MGYAGPEGYVADAASLPPPHEAPSPYQEVDVADLMDQFYEMAETDPDIEGDSEIGRELTRRILAHAGYADDPTTIPLVGSDGPIRDPKTQRPLMVVDYVNHAARHHGHALESILDFLLTEPGTPEYETRRAITLQMVSQQQTAES